MANLNGVDIGKGAQGAPVNTEGDSISAMIIATPAATGLALNEPTQVFNIDDAKALGLDEDHDTTNFVTAARQLREFYRMAGAGTKLYLMLVAQATTQVEIFTDTAVGAHDSPAKKLAMYAEGEVRQLSVSTNPTVAPVALNGMSADVYNAMPLAQAFAKWCYDSSMPLQVLLEGRDYVGNAAASADLKGIPNVKAGKVTVIIGQDWKYADSLATVNGATPVFMQTMADVGTAIGTVSKAAINQNMGDNEAFNLTDSGADAWMVAGLSNHVKNKKQATDLQTLENKGYVFGVTYVGISGVRWNGDHTCVATEIDADGNINEHTISYGRTLDKATRELRTALLPKVKSNHPVDPKTGLLPTGVTEYFRGIGLGVFNEMVLRKEISAGDLTIDANSDLVVEKVLKVTSFKVVPYGYANSIEGDINIKRSL